MIPKSFVPAEGTRKFSRLTIILSVFSLILGWSIFLPSSAQAVDIHTKNLNRYDILLQGDETRIAGSTSYGPLQVCGDIADLGDTLNTSGADMSVFLQTAGWLARVSIVGFATAAYFCGRQVTICASKAYYDHKWAGMTIQVAPWKVWCWEY
jgi:hypothetical protein